MNRSAAGMRRRRGSSPRAGGASSLRRPPPPPPLLLALALWASAAAAASEAAAFVVFPPTARTGSASRERLPSPVADPASLRRARPGRRRLLHEARPTSSSCASAREEDVGGGGRRADGEGSSPILGSFRRVAASVLRPKGGAGGGSAAVVDGGGDVSLYVDATANGAARAGEAGAAEATTTTTTDARAINYEIVRRGTAFVERTKGDAPQASSSYGAGGAAETGVLTSEAERVPGCVANVRVRVALDPLPGAAPPPAAAASSSSFGASDDDDDLLATASDYRVSLDGDADALLSRGLLSLFSDALRGDGVTAADVLSLHGPDVADLLGLRAVLSEGRNDGLASMTGTAQGQIRRLLGGGSGSVAADGFGEVEGEAAEGAAASKEEDDDEDDGRPTVAVLLSGGVDSSVALHLLLRQNYRVTAFYLRIWLEDELAHLGRCPWEDDYAVCKSVCERAGVPLEAVSLQEQYRDRVVSYTVDEARRGRTPNPDVVCNSRIKFGCFYDAIEGRGFDYVASGHYARLEKEGGVDVEGNAVVRLHRAPDPVKDQSYFLSALTQPQLRRALFPLGNMHKSEVRALADEFRLPNRDRPDSQGLCFLGKVKFDEFLSAYLGDDPGDVVDAADGRVIGRHRGLWYHTVGQRRGIGPVLDPLETSRGPWYVVAKDPDRNVVVVSNRYDEEEAFRTARSDFYVEDITWIKGEVPSCLQADVNVTHANGDGDGSKGGGTARLWHECRFDMKIRHGPTIARGTLILDESVPGGTAGTVRLDEKDKGLAPGQFCVFYDGGGDECLGSGVIGERHWATFLSDDDGGGGGDDATTARPRPLDEAAAAVK